MLFLLLRLAGTIAVTPCELETYPTSERQDAHPRGIGNQGFVSIILRNRDGGLSTPQRSKRRGKGNGRKRGGRAMAINEGRSVGGEYRLERYRYILRQIEFLNASTFRALTLYQGLASAIVGAAVALFVGWREAGADAETARMALRALVGLLGLVTAFVVATLLIGVASWVDARGEEVDLLNAKVLPGYRRRPWLRAAWRWYKTVIVVASLAFFVVSWFFVERIAIPGSSTLRRPPMPRRLRSPTARNPPHSPTTPARRQAGQPASTLPRKVFGVTGGQSGHDSQQWALDRRRAAPRGVRTRRACRPRPPCPMNSPSVGNDLAEFLEDARRRVDEALDRFLPAARTRRPPARRGWPRRCGTACSAAASGSGRSWP